MRTIEPDQHGVYLITELRPPAPRSPVEPDPLAPPTVKIPRFRMTDETFSTSSADHYRRQSLIDDMMRAHLDRVTAGDSTNWARAIIITTS